jgi:hypothetical protein
VCYITLIGKAYQWQILQLIGPICKLQRKRSVANVTPGTVFTMLYFFVTSNGPNKLECCITLIGKAYQWQILQLIGPICKLWRKRSVVNATPGTVFTMLHFL